MTKDRITAYLALNLTSIVGGLFFCRGIYREPSLMLSTNRRPFLVFLVSEPGRSAARRVIHLAREFYEPIFHRLVDVFKSCRFLLLNLREICSKASAAKSVKIGVCRLIFAAYSKT